MDRIDFSALSADALRYLPKLGLALVVIVVGFWLAGRLARLLGVALARRDVDATVIPFLTSLLSVVFKALVLLSAASMFGVDVTSFVAIFSALTLAIGLALQSNLSHFASGLLLLTVRPYKVGDIVTVGGQTGRVVAIQIFHTILATPDNQRHIVPNGKVTGDTITNLSGQGTRGIDLNIGIAYGDDIARAREVILAVVTAHENVLTDPEPTVVVTGLGDSSVNLLTRPFTISDEYWATRVELIEQVKVALDAAGITIPFPQRELWVRGPGAPGNEEATEAQTADADQPGGSPGARAIGEGEPPRAERYADTGGGGGDASAGPSSGPAGV